MTKTHHSSRATRPREARRSFTRRLRQAGESLMLRLFFGVLGRVPPALHGPIASVWTYLARLWPQRRGVLHENLDIAFGPQPPAERARLAREITRNTVLFGLEVARLSRARPEEVLRGIGLPHDGQEHADPLLASGRGFIVGSAHLGNWEWMAAWYGLVRGNFGVVYKPMHNPDADAVARALRERFGIKILSTRERVPRALFTLLRRGGTVAILGDQDARREGKFLPFFGKPASTATGMASLALRLGAPIVPAFCLREAPCRFRIKVYPPIWPDPAAADPEAEELRLTAAYLAAVEDAIRQTPEQYFWWHRRWKTKPKDLGARTPSSAPNAE